MEQPETAGVIGARTQGAIEAMATLRRRCPWSSRQDHSSLEKYAREETEELIEALADYRADPNPDHRAAVVEELGDVFYQVLFHSALLDESGSAPYGHTLGMIVEGLEAKLIRRHPLAFGEDASDEQMASLEDVEREYRRIKTEEKQQKDTNQ
ncbi:MazG nucleotide pyrophosphohydrolase domain-containing protein [Brevibacterium sp. CBA3109]|uniref:MazG nucleotide pyrophosphohydrolase domain-containing protein n=1 Tax=Brevibacterium koreense TaxID=3140787 RepID=A0AAU7UPA5_9MICO